ncbi:MAG: hypothetical protein IPK18_08745 [Sphingobacteriales bacterium]|nr:MAG: hypothetical protein IPK18_08745 [Sphingobacteriales bacterium]
MMFQSNIVSEISEYVDKLPKQEQIKLLSRLKKQIQPKVKKVSNKQILELSKEINKSIFKNHTKKRLDALDIR